MTLPFSMRCGNEPSNHRVFGVASAGTVVATSKVADLTAWCEEMCIGEFSFQKAEFSNHNHGVDLYVFYFSIRMDDAWFAHAFYKETNLLLADRID